MSAKIANISSSETGVMKLTHGDLEVTGLDDLFSTERVRMHRQLYSAISHDLKTPLASIIGALEIYERMKPRLTEQKQAELILTALQEAHRLDNFITNILDMGRLENGMVSVRTEAFEVGAALRGCVSSFDNRLLDNKVTIAALSGELNISSDHSLLCRVISLLLDNSIKYGGKPPLIQLTYEQGENNTCLIHVQDNGPGIPEAHRESIFTKYTRFIKRDQQHAGTGLGLAISREIVHLLGGTITVADAPDDSGAVFTLTLPLSLD